MKKYQLLWAASNLFSLCSMASVVFLSDILISAHFALTVNVFNQLTFLCLLYSVCTLDNIPLARHWGTFGLMLLLYGVICLFYTSGDWIIFAPFYIYQLFLLANINFHVIRRWRFRLRTRVLSSLILLCFGLALTEISLPLSVGITQSFGLATVIFFLVCLNLLFSVLVSSILESNKSLEKSYLHHLTENAVDIIFHYALEPYPRFLFISPSAESIVGYQQKDFYQNSHLHLELTHEDDRIIMSKAFSKDSSSINKNYVRWQRKDGEYIYIEFHNTPVFTDGRVTAIDGILRDITDRKLVEQDLLDSRKSRQILLSYISHELKTPITYIIGYAEALQKNLFTNAEEQKNSVELISSKALVLQRLVDDLFQLSKMESNQFRFHFMQVSVSDFFELLVNKCSGDIVSAGIEFVYTIEDVLTTGNFEILADIERMEQVCFNLIHNAIKHTPQRGRITLQCLYHESKSSVLFKFHDTGSGIAEEDIPHVFERFYRSKDSSRHNKDGSGLGLSLTKLIIEAHQGIIDVVSKQGRGSTFYFTIPLYTQEQHNQSNR